MQIKKTTKTSVKASKSFETIGLEPRQRTALDGKTYWVVFDTEEQKYSTLTQFGKYDSKKDCQYAIDKYKSQLSKTLGRDFADTDDVDACGDIKGCSASTSTDKALQHIKAAIDILATSAKTSEVARDSIANLSVVLFDIKASKDCNCCGDIKASILTEDQKDELWEIADSYTTSSPKSGDWNTETIAEQQEIADHFGISMDEAKQLMIDELGFGEEDF